MNRPSPVAGVLAFLGWVVLAALCSVVLLPPLPSLRTAVWAASVVLFAAAVLAPLRSLPVVGLAVAVSGVSSLAFGLAHPAAVAPVPLAAYLAGSALRSIYDLERPPARHGLTPLWRAFAAVSAVSALSAFVLARTAYLLVRDVPPPRVVNRLGLDAEQAVAGTVAMLAALFLAAGFHALGVRAGRDRHGARLVDATLVVVALAAGGTALLQKAGLVPHLRAAHWATWGRAQSTFTDPSAAGVGAALLLAPCLALVASGGWPRRLAAGFGAAGLLVLLADAGSRGGFIGALVSVLVLVLWAATHALAGQKPGVRRRVALSAGTLAILVALAFGAALAWPTGQGGRSALLARISESFGKKEATTLGEPQRLLLYEGALALAREHPVTGSGLGTFRSRFPDAARDLLGTDVSFTDHPPSLYLGVLAETGLAGTLVLALLLAGLLPALRGGHVRLAPAQGGRDDVEQALVPERFFQEVEGAVLHGLHRQLDVAVAGDEHDRQAAAARDQGLLQLQPAHARHAHVEQQAAGLVERGQAVLEVIRRRGVRLHGPAHGFEQEHQRAAERGVVVDQVDLPVRRHGRVFGHRREASA